MVDLVGMLGAAARDMDMAATLSDERRKALERHAVERFWRVIADGLQGGAVDRAALPAERDGK